MRKKDKGEKKKKWKEEEGGKQDQLGKSSVGAYADGHPLHDIQYLEAKLILKPDRFTCVESFREFAKLVKKTAKKEEVDFVPDAEAGLRPNIREILFLDTPDFRLYNNAFILRRRISYVDGFPVGDPEIVFKYRHPDEKTAAAVDVRPKISGKYRIKFKAEALPLKDRIGSYRVLYSHNCVFGLSQVHEADRTSMRWLHSPGTLFHRALSLRFPGRGRCVRASASKRFCSNWANWISAKGRWGSATWPFGAHAGNTSPL